MENIYQAPSLGSPTFDAYIYGQLYQGLSLEAQPIVDSADSHYLVKTQGGMYLQYDDNGNQVVEVSGAMSPSYVYTNNNHEALLHGFMMGANTEIAIPGAVPFEAYKVTDLNKAESSAGSAGDPYIQCF